MSSKLLHISCIGVSVLNEFDKEIVTFVSWPRPSPLVSTAINDSQLYVRALVQTIYHHSVSASLIDPGHKPHKDKALSSHVLTWRILYITCMFLSRPWTEDLTILLLTIIPSVLPLHFIILMFTIVWFIMYYHYVMTLLGPVIFRFKKSNFPFQKKWNSVSIPFHYWQRWIWWNHNISKESAVNGPSKWHN